MVAATIWRATRYGLAREKEKLPGIGTQFPRFRSFIKAAEEESEPSHVGHSSLQGRFAQQSYQVLEA
jgi:hypothetical protein